jgi:hypothetical protein
MGFPVLRVVGMQMQRPRASLKHDARISGKLFRCTRHSWMITMSIERGLQQESRLP